ncbi:MAG TPA: hypothetical protein DHW64_01670 [Chitinophagaceae bacterium]|jgi:hypothetical protein|nr:hypothetical protein [Chitinophagaceae bacterium]
MKYVVTIILSLSLYAPQVAKILAYAECSALAITMADQNWCDCMFTTDTDTDGIPATEKQKDIQFKTDWKFTPEKNIVVATIKAYPASTKNSFISFQLPAPYLKAVFHPPLG